MVGTIFVRRAAVLMHDTLKSARPLQAGIWTGRGVAKRTAADHNHHDNDYAHGARRNAASAALIPLLDRHLLHRDIALRCPVDAAHRPYPLSIDNQPNGRFALIRAASVWCTSAALLSWRLRFAFFDDSKCRREDCVLKTLPRAVILKRFATDLRVLLRAIGFGIRRGR